MNNDYFAFGEILWDVLPSGHHAGGAPFNVAAHLAQLGVSAWFISSVGRDPLGDELLEFARGKGVDTRFMARARDGLPTGTAVATLDQAGNATYDVVQPAAWDEIAASGEVLEAVQGGAAFVYGSLSARLPYNVEQLNHLLDLEGPVKFFDVNLRPPFFDPAEVIRLAQRADVIKLNHDEVARLAGWLRSGVWTEEESEAGLAEINTDCASIAAATKTARLCVTLGSRGAAFWENGTLVHVPAPAVKVRDTVGAGDAFMAALVVGLTRGIEPRTVLESACRLGAFVASNTGAIPQLPAELASEIAAAFKP